MLFRSDSNSPSSPSLSPTINTTSDITPSGNYPNHLHPVNAPAPTLNSLEENPLAPAPAVTIPALLIHPSTTTTPSKITISCPPHTTPASTTLTLVPSGPPNPLHHHLPPLDINHHLFPNANRHRQCPTTNLQNLKNHHLLK